MLFVTVYGALRTTATAIKYRFQPEPAAALAQFRFPTHLLNRPAISPLIFPPYPLCLWLTSQGHIPTHLIHWYSARLLHILSHHVVRHPPLSSPSTVLFVAAFHSPSHPSTLSTAYTHYPHASPSSRHGACQEYRGCSN